MQLRDGEAVFSASDLNNFLECEHSTQLDMLLAGGGIKPSFEKDESTALLSRKGDEHEARCLAQLLDEGRQVVTISGGPNQVAETVQVMQQGAEVIYQAAFEHEGWLGYADFLFRVPTSSRFGDWSYEVADAKLARSVKPYHVLQLCFYSEHVTRIQDREPAQIRVMLGNGQTESLLLAEYAPYYRAVRERFLEELRDTKQTYPIPCHHCGVCRWNDHCTAQRERDDHLSQVANIARSQIKRLSAGGIVTMGALAAADPPLKITGIGDVTAERLRSQAELQLHHRQTGAHRYDVLPPSGPHRGFALLPPPSPGDIFFDMEGNPFAEGGLEYLFGAITIDTGEPVFTDFWGHDRLAEKRAFEAFMDFVTERLTRFPDLHIYHYASYEATALKRLMGLHATREEEVDQLLRRGKLIDLYAVVRNGVRVSQPSYSIKKLEPFYMEARQAGIKDAGSSVVAYEEWIESGEQQILDDIRDYNRDDCISTWKLADWLRSLAQEAADRFGLPTHQEVEVVEPSEEVLARVAEREKVAAKLLEDVPELEQDRTPQQQGRWLLAQLLDWHRREDKPAWWAFFDKLGKSEDELLDDSDCIGGVTVDADVEPELSKQSLIYTLRFPPQEHKISRGKAYDPATLKPAGEIMELRDVDGVIRLRRGKKMADLPLPTAFMPPPPIDSKALSDSVLRVANSCLETGLGGGGGDYQAVRGLILGLPPRIPGLDTGAPLIANGSDSLDQLLSLGERLEATTLFIQGPPGAGKTYSAARLIVRLMRSGKRVGVSAFTHKAIDNLLAAVEKHARETGYSFRGLKKSSKDGTEFDGEYISSEKKIDGIVDALDDVQLIAGTAWLFASEKMVGTVETLFVDEAGQISLANVVAIGPSARNIVLIGDPAQLAQPSQGVHPEGAGASGLEHLLGDHQTIPPDRGVFLGVSHRMHPSVCDFISETMYEGRLGSSEKAARQHVGGGGWLEGTGIRFMSVPHEGNTQRSPEEATAVADLVQSLLGKSFIDQEGAERALTIEDILVVTPYNAQVRCLRDALPDGARVGTVDKFQGQEAPVVVFSMATSSGEELPRTLEFLFSRSRLNVAISRAQALAILVASPALFRVRCKTLSQMRLTAAFCRLLEFSRLG